MLFMEIRQWVTKSMSFRKNYSNWRQILPKEQKRRTCKFNICWDFDASSSNDLKKTSTMSVGSKAAFLRNFWTLFTTCNIAKFSSPHIFQIRINDDIMQKNNRYPNNLISAVNKILVCVKYLTSKPSLKKWFILP